MIRWIRTSRPEAAWTIVLLLFFAACGGEGARERSGVVATVRPLAAIVEPVVGSDVHVLLSSGASPHTYDPRPSDIRTSAAASVFVFGSIALDGWAADLDAGAKIGLMSLVPDSLLLRHVEESEHADPHFWMDPLTVRSILPALTDTLCLAIPSECEGYRDRADAFADRLSAVHDSLSVLMREARGSALLLSHPFLGYFARRYELSIAGIIEEIPGSEPTPNDIMRLLQQVRATDAKVIFTLPQHPSRAARVISEATDLPVVELDPIGGGVNGYEDLLYFNAEKIRDALADPTSDT